MTNKLSGYLKKIYRRDENSGIVYFGIDTEELDVVRNADGYVYACGVIPKWPTDLYIIAEGIWEDKVYNITAVKPYTETEEVSKKLLKNIVKELKNEKEDFKLSPTGMKKILEVTGIDILEFMKRDDALEVLHKSLPKIDSEKLDLIYKKFEILTESYDIMNYISKFGGSPYHCVKLVSHYGKSALQSIRTHPYRAGYIAGMDFFTSDRIGRDVKVDVYNEERIKSIIYTALYNKIQSSGSTYVPKEILESTITSICRKSSFPKENIPYSIMADTLTKMSGVYVEERGSKTRIYKKSLYENEKNIVNHLMRLTKSRKTYEFDPSSIKEAEDHLKIKYSERQKESFQSLFSSGVKIITGGPGTGKTTVVNGILYLYKKLHPEHNILLCAPTGRASQRMSEVTQMEASTIHRALDFRPYGDGRLLCKDNEHPLEGDLIVLDEMSMVDTEIFSLLLPAIKSGGTLIMLGDENQLQSVSPGNILHDLINSHQFEVYQLKEVFRQKGKQTIVDNAYRILHGDMRFEKDESFHISCFNNVEAAANEIIRLFYKDYENHEDRNVQILSATNKGDGGTEKINEIIADKIHKMELENKKTDPEKDAGTETEAKPEYFRYKSTTYRENNRVIFTKNNYEKGYYNGDMGYVNRILKNGFTVILNEQEIRVTGECLNDVSLAYAISIHKSQGSEANTIYILLSDEFENMLDKNLLFTAVTRAKSCVHILYVNSALYNAVNTCRVNRRHTGLEDRLKYKKREEIAA